MKKTKTKNTQKARFWLFKILAIIYVSMKPRWQDLSTVLCVTQLIPLTNYPSGNSYKGRKTMRRQKINGEWKLLHQSRQNIIHTVNHTCIKAKQNVTCTILVISPTKNVCLIIDKRCSMTISHVWYANVVRVMNHWWFQLVPIHIC